MRKKICRVCGEDLENGEKDICGLCIDLSVSNINTGEVNVNKSIRREFAKDRRASSKRRFDEES
jgi:NMD protein affecting ribosome stability and mRNA decay